MNDKNVEMMRKLLDEKKQKNVPRIGKGVPDGPGNTRLGKKKQKRGGLFDR